MGVGEWGVAGDGEGWTSVADCEITALAILPKLGFFPPKVELIADSSPITLSLVSFCIFTLHHTDRQADRQLVITTTRNMI